MATTYGITFSCLNGSNNGALVTVTGTAPAGSIHPAIMITGQPHGENGGKLYGQAWASDSFNADHGTVLSGYVTDVQNGIMVVDKSVNYTVTCAGKATTAVHESNLPALSTAAVSATTVLALAAAVLARRLRG